MTATTLDGRLVRIPAPPRRVGFLQAIGLFYRRYFVLLGRSSRSEYWYGFLYGTALQVLLALAFVLAGGTSFLAYFTAPPGTEAGAAAVVDFIGQGVGLVHVIPSVTSTVRRLHDAGYSGWFFLIALLPLLGPVILLFFLLRPSVPLSPEFAHLGYDWEDDKRFAEPFRS
ncbi:DUF805 domain-containing protein [Kocuria sp.]|uniref:DUF805 domain-containing protein n=1 Tax=Kocuria sp. TaxID=1871328 RepID=UPI0026DFDBEC|nr:DUF805 domain-containing protein [Kocuria sp.]MDO5617968.1 DUF805 domain-containing protein [Kocuria sp.]